MKHPYSGLPDRQFWRKEPGIVEATALDPVGEPPFKISPEEKVVTCGSCFAQHVARYMSKAGFNHYITERAHPMFSEKVAEKYHYGMFAARYGNIYTARQLRQLLERAYGSFDPLEVSWPSSQGPTVVDPFRPQIQPGGYTSEAELLADREQHFRCIREAIENMDVFVFTLGLTEGWMDTRDGAVFPIAPGVAGGIYDPSTVAFVNFDEAETYADLQAAFAMIRDINPAVRLILTVSPVALNATYEDRHVLLSTTWSKAVLRTSAEKATRNFDDCVYFPSYEIITSPHVRGRYFGPDCREVTGEGVDHVMRLFIQHFTSGKKTVHKPAVDERLAEKTRRHLAEMQEVIDVLCDEAAIGNE